MKSYFEDTDKRLLTCFLLTVTMISSIVGLVEIGL